MNVHAWLLLLRNQGLGFVREPVAAGFNLLIPFFIILVQAFAFGDEPIGEDLPDHRVVDLLPVGAATIFIMIIGVFGMGVGLASMIEARTLAAFRLRPGGLPSILSAYGTVLVVITMAGLIVSTLVLAAGWGIYAPARPLLLLPTGLLGCWLFLALGACAAGASGSARSAQGVSSAVFFPLLFLSGAMFPVSSFPDALQSAATVLPGQHLYEVTAYGWIGDQELPVASLAYLALGCVLASTGAVWLLRRREQL